MDEDTLHRPNGLRLSQKSGGNHAICRNKNGLGDDHTRSNKSDRARQTSDVTYTSHLKTDHGEPTFKSKRDSQTGNLELMRGKLCKG